MANQEHIDIVKQGTEAWNEWRLRNPDVVPDLSGADLRGINLDASFPGSPRFIRSDECPQLHCKPEELGPANMRGADLRRTDLCGSRLMLADFSGADLRGAWLCDVSAQCATFTKAKLGKAEIANADLGEAVFAGADLRGATLYDVDLHAADLHGANLNWAGMQRSDLRGANLRSAKLRKADLTEASLFGANLTDAKLTGAVLMYANLAHACLKGSDLTGADLTCSNLASACLDDATLVNCSVYGVSAWDASLRGTVQSELTISVPGQDIICVTVWQRGDAPENVPRAQPLPRPRITLDDLKAVPFIESVLRNAVLDDVIGTINSRVALLLGRFTSNRRNLLGSFRQDLKRRGYMPIAIDFSLIPIGDVDPMVWRLARLARFAIAEITESSELPLHLKHFVKNERPVPLAYFLEEGTHLYDDTMFEHFKRFPSILDPQYYSDDQDACGKLEQVIEQLEELQSLLQTKVVNVCGDQP